MSFLNLEVLKGKFIKSKGIMPHLKCPKICFWDKEIQKQTKIATHMDLWKYGQILTIQKSLTIKGLRFSKKWFLIWVYHLVLHYVLKPNNKFGMWINIIFFPFCDVWVRWPTHIFQLQKSIPHNSLHNEIVSLDPSPN